MEEYDHLLFLLHKVRFRWRLLSSGLKLVLRQVLFFPKTNPAVRKWSPSPRNSHPSSQRGYFVTGPVPYAQPRLEFSSTYLTFYPPCPTFGYCEKQNLASILRTQSWKFPSSIHRACVRHAPSITSIFPV